MESTKEETVNRILSLVKEGEVNEVTVDDETGGVTGGALTVTHNGKTYPVDSFAGTVASYPENLAFLKTDANIALAAAIDEQIDVARAVGQRVQRVEIALARNTGHPRFLRAFFEVNVEAQRALAELEQRKIAAQEALIATFAEHHVSAATEQDIDAEVSAFEAEHRQYLLQMRNRIAAAMGVTPEQLDEIGREVAAENGLQFNSPADGPSKLN